MLEQNKEQLIWVFKRLPKSEYDQHLVYKMIYPSQFPPAKRQGWNLYQSPKSVDEYLFRMKDKWDNPWAR